MSQPARAVWIEIVSPQRSTKYGRPSQPARAVWIEIMVVLTLLCPRTASQPARAVWIEIVGFPMHALPIGMSQPARAVWIEIPWKQEKDCPLIRHSLRGLCGLKYKLSVVLNMVDQVTACEGCVD